MYGMAPSRGARHLLRNGLDYLNYQQYERALKFLRDAETRQKELNEPEKLALKQGIERAQRGLREAADAESPYAISERSRRRNGFAPAPAETQIAATAAQAKLPVQKKKANRAAPRAPLASDGDEQGEPIQLASGETPVNSPTVEVNPGTPLSQTTNAAPPLGAEPGQPASMPEIPQLPPVTQLADPTESNSSVHHLAAGEQSPSGTDLTSAQARHMPPQTLVVPAEKQPKGQPEPLSTLPQLVPATESAAPTPDLAAAAAASTAEPVTTTKVPSETAQPTTPILAQSMDQGLLPEASKNVPVIDLETIPSAATSPATSPSADPTAPAHRENEEALPAAASATALNTLENQPSPTATAIPSATTEAVEELPPLPSNLGRPIEAATAPDNSASPSVRAPAPLTASSGADDLPPLPADLGRSDSAESSTTTSPAPVNVMPATAPPAVVDPATRPVQPTPIGDTPMPIGDVERPAVSIVTGDSRKPNESSAVIVSPVTQPTTGASTSPVAEGRSEPTNSELPPLPGAPANSPASTAPSPTQPYPTTNPNLERQTPAMDRASAEAMPDVASLPPALPGRMLASSSDSFIPDRANPPSTLRPDLQREIEQIARSQEEEMRRQAQAQPPPAPAAPSDTTSSDLRTQTQLDISRAPSPAEARPIKAIPVPEDWVPLPPRNWSPQRKYWAAAATCHLPLYFQDPVLERYGHSVEQFVGPVGRFLTYPVDDPTQSTQRNQMLQPFFSAGLMGLQIIAWPYNLIMDPPWEAQYDLGYYRPGDNIPTDTYWLPLHGYGPPLRGSNY